jgi:ATP-dependent DNA ligase
LAGALRDGRGRLLRQLPGAPYRQLDTDQVILDGRKIGSLQMALRLPPPMLARSGAIPTGDYAFEVKWDGFRALVSRNGDFQVRSRDRLVDNSSRQ